MKLTILVGFALCSAAASADVAPSKPQIQYVGAISIQPSQDAKVLADWYTKFGVETQFYQGGYYGMFKTAGGPFFFAVHPKREGAAKESSASVSVVFRVSDYKGYIAMLAEHGLKPLSTEGDSTGEFAHFKDPDGNEMTVWGD